MPPMTEEEFIRRQRRNTDEDEFVGEPPFAFKRTIGPGVDVHFNGHELRLSRSYQTKRKPGGKSYPAVDTIYMNRTDLVEFMRYLQDVVRTNAAPGKMWVLPRWP